MLKRIYIDNFRCLVNFDLNVDAINLILGGNGSGKSTVFYWLDRQSNAPVRVKKIDREIGDNSGLSISESIARGWLNEST